MSTKTTRTIEGVLDAYIDLPMTEGYEWGIYADEPVNETPGPLGRLYILQRTPDCVEHLIIYYPGDEVLWEGDLDFEYETYLNGIQKGFTAPDWAVMFMSEMYDREKTDPKTIEEHPHVGQSLRAKLVVHDKGSCGLD